MTPPRIVAVSFGPSDGGWSEDGGTRYSRLTRVLAHTAAVHCREWDRQIAHLGSLPSTLTSAKGNPSHIWNTQKLHAWVEAVDEAADGDRVLLMDTDMFITRPLDPLWDRAFDIAYTARRHSHRQAKFPHNGGVLAVRVSPQSRRFMAMWRAINDAFLGDVRQHQAWWPQYQGINQSAFGCLMETGGHECHVIGLRCLEWNCENSEWASFDPQTTRIVHVKSKLRRALFNIPNPRDGVVSARLVAMWRGLEAQAMRAQPVGVAS
jgi:hypothetical protein